MIPDFFMAKRSHRILSIGFGALILFSKEIFQLCSEIVTATAQKHFQWCCHCHMRTFKRRNGADWNVESHTQPRTKLRWNSLNWCRTIRDNKKLQVFGIVSHHVFQKNNRKRFFGILWNHFLQDEEPPFLTKKCGLHFSKENRCHMILENHEVKMLKNCDCWEF